jgi:hypothetical protein
MDLIDLEDDTIDAEVMDSLAVIMDNFRVYGHGMSIWQWMVCWEDLSLRTLQWRVA